MNGTFLNLHILRSCFTEINHLSSNTRSGGMGKRLQKTQTYFIMHIAKPFIDKTEDEIHCTYFDIRDYEKILKK